jgi:hypothetical protein
VPYGLAEVASAAAGKALSLLAKGKALVLAGGVISIKAHQHGNPPHPIWLLRARSDRPHGCGAGKCDEVPPLHWSSRSAEDSILPHRMGAIVRHKKNAGLTSVVGPVTDSCAAAIPTHAACLRCLLLGSCCFNGTHGFRGARGFTPCQQHSGR